MSCTIAEAMERVGPDWLSLIPAVARQFKREQDETAYAVAETARQARLAHLVAQQGPTRKWTSPLGLSLR